MADSSQLSTAGTSLGIAGIMLQAYGGFEAGQAAKTAADNKRAEAQFESQQETQQAGQYLAASQRVAFDQELQTQYLKSSLQAKAAASGGGVTDPTIMNLQGAISGQGSYKAATDLYQGEAAARLLRLKASSDLVSGEIGADASLAAGREAEIGAAAGVIKSTSALYDRSGSMYSRYAGVGPPASGASIDAGTPNKTYG